MKRAGILTFHNANNFGAVLQVYALNKYLEELNIDSEVIDYRNPFCDKVNNEYMNIYSSKKVELMKCKINFYWFRKKHLTLSETIYRLNEKSIPNYDYYIVGSDQIWNPLYSQEEYLLPFPLKPAVKISYAASIGIDVDHQKMKEKMFEKNIPDFDYLSIREKKYEGFLQKFTSTKVSTVLDPTLLLDEKDYSKLIPKKQNKEKYILFHFFDYKPHALHFAQKLAKKLNYKIIFFSATNNQNALYDLGHSSIFYKSPKEFLWYIKNAELIITHSFHATIFSILFKKPFYAFLHEETGGRIESICNTLGLEGRIMNKNQKIKDLCIDIDYGEVHKKLEQERIKSIAFLKEALGVA